VPADFIMSRQMLRGVKERAERTTAEDLLAVDLSPAGSRVTIARRLANRVTFL